MYEFITKRLTRVPGIQRTVTNNIVRILKREFPKPLALNGAPVGRFGGRPEAVGRSRRRGSAGQERL
jgi:hypothetical protein